MLEGLLSLKGERLSYKALDVEQIGSVYETVMGFRVERASGPMLAIKAGKNNKTPVYVDLNALLNTKPADRKKYLKEECQRSNLTKRQEDALKAATSVEDLAAALDPIVDERASPHKRPAPQGTPILARLAFVAMNEAVETAGRRRFAAERGVPLDQIGALKWRPFQLAFILVNLSGLTDKTHPDREIVDLLFFPTGGGKTEAYLGLAAYTIALRRLGASGLLGAGVTVIMRYTLRLLTLDQLGRAAGVICALELMRCSDAWKDAQGRRMLGDWDIEIGLWIGSAASPNRLGGKGDTGDDRAVTRVRAYRRRSGPAPAPIRNCPWCGSNLDHNSFKCWPNEQMPSRMLIVCKNVDCDFTGDRALPILATDDEIYRRLPAFIVATIDKFAALPWVGQTGAFFGHVDRADNQGFYGASEPRSGARLSNGWQLDPPDLIVQDELHLISGPLGTVAGLYETAIDYLATRTKGDIRIRPKIVASTQENRFWTWLGL